MLLLKLRPDCEPLIRQHQQQQQQQLTFNNNNNNQLNEPCHQASVDTTTAASELSLERRLSDEFYYDADSVGEGPSRARHHPHEDFDTFYDDDDPANVRHSGDYDYHHGDPHHHPKPVKKKKRHRSKKFHKAPFYAEIAGYNPPQGIILNPKDSIFTPGIEPGGLAGITPKFLKYLRGHVKNIGKTKSKKKKRLDP